jgi:hypothetical protein
MPPAVTVEMLKGFSLFMVSGGGERPRRRADRARAHQSMALGDPAICPAPPSGPVRHAEVAAAANDCSNPAIATTVASAAAPNPCRAASQAGSL